MVTAAGRAVAAASSEEKTAGEPHITALFRSRTFVSRDAVGQRCTRRSASKQERVLSNLPRLHHSVSVCSKSFAAVSTVFGASSPAETSSSRNHVLCHP